MKQLHLNFSSSTWHPYIVMVCVLQHHQVWPLIQFFIFTFQKGKDNSNSFRRRNYTHYLLNGRGKIEGKWFCLKVVCNYLRPRLFFTKNEIIWTCEPTWRPRIGLGCRGWTWRWSQRCSQFPSGQSCCSEACTHCYERRYGTANTWKQIWNEDHFFRYFRSLLLEENGEKQVDC